MRVLHIAKVSGMGGAERMLLSLLPRLRSEGVDAHMLVLASDDAERFVAPMRAVGVPTQTVPMNHDVSARALPAILRATRRLSPDIVHTHLFHADAYGQLAARLMRIPGVTTMQSVMEFFSRQPYRSLARASHANAYATIAISQHVANYLHATRIAPPSKTAVIFYGIDVDDWMGGTERRVAARDAYGIPRDAFVIGITGRMSPGKGHEVLLAAFERLGDDPSIHLVMVGDGEAFTSVSARANSSAFAKQIHMLGYCADTRDALAAFDVAVVPTSPELDEGFGLVALEAMAFGLPVVASHLGALTEVVLDGVTGTLVHPNDDVELAQALRDLHQSPSTRAAMGAAGSHRAAALFSLDAMVHKTIAVYERRPTARASCTVARVKPTRNEVTTRATQEGGDVIGMVDLGAQITAMGDGLRTTILGVIDDHQFVLGPEVAQLEAELASRTGAVDVVTCANGTDALVLALRALGVGPGDHVVVPAFTFAATAEAVVLAGGVPVFADIRPDTFNLDAASVREHLASLGGAPPVGIVPVDLFGHVALDDRLDALAAEQGWWVLVDAAQSYGASVEGRRAGSLGSLATTSFFPAKPLGCFGDGGAVFCPDGSSGDLLRSLRNHGAGADRYENVRVGTNSRLDTLQAAVLLAKLERYDEEHARRRELAARYEAAFAGSSVVVPVETPGAVSAWAQYTVRVPRRDEVVAQLTAAGIGTSVYYRSTLADQAAFSGSPVLGDLPMARAACAQVVSIPVHPYLSDADQDRCIEAVLAATGGCRA